MKQHHQESAECPATLIRTPYVLAGCEMFRQRSVVSGLDYEIFVSVPDVEPPASGFPVIYLLDGNSDFVTVSETMKRVSRRPQATGISPSIVVGIGYPDTESYNIDRRQFDLTRHAPDEAALPDASSGACGGQDAFVAFLRTQLQPHIETIYPADPGRRMLMGHSLAGYFVLDLMSRRPELFSGYISFSPSIWWDCAGLMQAVAAMERAPSPPRLHISAGRWEQELAPWQDLESLTDRYHQVREARRMIDNAREFADAIRPVIGEKAVKFEVGADEDHSTIVTVMLCRALRFVAAR
ncbi:alpha/beta hydrolase [Rhizobium sp. NPDC090275]|uniref:alpha/beta hydrolase n=1 Tax=Rhizobium sp. NPDC090275 TaxID=3364498 RepID=UPI003839D526